MDVQVPMANVSKVDNFEEMEKQTAAAETKGHFCKSIHKIWWQSLNQLPEKYIEPLQSWSIHNPDWRIYVWDENSINALFTAFYPEHKALIENYPRMIQKIDAAKYFILAKFGGLYSDMDQTCLKPLTKAIKLDEKVPSILVSPLTNKKSLIPLTSSFCFTEPPFFNNAWILAKPDQAVWKPVIEQLYKAEEDMETTIGKMDLVNQNDEVAVLRTTGPVCFTKALRKVIKAPEMEDHAVKILDPNIVEPYSVYFKMGNPKYYHKLETAIHLGDKAIAVSSMPSSWTNADKKRFYLVRKVVHLAYRHEIKKELSVLSEKPSQLPVKLEIPNTA